jgi:citrate lyase subunit gamma (acyl carrier protein)
MAKVLAKSATAGFEEKNDALVTVTPGQTGSGIVINLKSSVQRQYGKHIVEVIKKTVTAAGFADVVLDVIDKGAWDYTMEARVEGALERGMK